MTQSEALKILKTGANVFLTGEPGSGKTHTVNALVDWLRASGVEPSVTAATGIAATHVGGMTLHSWSGIGIAESLSPADIDRIATKEHVAKRIGRAKVLIIEEVSMLSAATLEMADAVCREVRRVDLPFGGLTVVLVGDFFQLPPISRNKESIFCYSSRVWRDLNLITCYLTEQYRQDDADFLEVLSAIRRGEVIEEHRRHLDARRAESNAPAGTPQLFSHNVDVDRINTAALAAITGVGKKFYMSSKGKDSLVDGLKRGCLSPEILELKEGAAVMFTKNSPQGKFVNGTLGVVTGWGDDGAPIVKTKSGVRVHTEPMEWQVEEQGKVKASVAQIPLRLAYAMTVHKSQGMSMDAAVIDLSRAFEYGQGYVALSRVRRLTGLFLTGLNERALEVHPEVLRKDGDFRAASDAAREAFTEMSEKEVEGMQKKFVTAMGGAWLTPGEEKKMREKGKGKRAPQSGAREGALPGRLAETLRAAREATGLAAVAKSRGFVISTIVHHLEELADLERLAPEDFRHLLPTSEIVEEIQLALTEQKDDKLAPVFQSLRGKYSFEIIRLVRLATKYS